MRTIAFWYSESNSRHFERFGVAGLGVMLVGEGAADDEVGGGGAPGSEYLRSVSVLGRGAYGRVAAEMGGGGQTSGTRGRHRLVHWAAPARFRAAHGVGSRSGHRPLLGAAGQGPWG